MVHNTCLPLTAFLRIPWPPLAACAAGALIGVMYTLSPMTVWLGLAIAAIVGWAGHGLTGRERVWVFGILSLAVGLRLLAIILFVFITHRFDGSFPDLIPDERYIVRRSTILGNIAQGIPITSVDYIEATLTYGESGLMYVLGYSQIQLGLAPYGMRLLNVTLYLAACVTLYRTVRPAFGRVAALGGLTIVLFMPTMFVWSISVLKEPLYLFAVAVSVAAGTAMLKAGTLAKRLLALIVCVGAVSAAESLRFGGHLMVGGGILVGLVMATWIRRPLLLLTTLLLCLPIGIWALDSPRIQAQGTNLLRASIRSHVGHVASPGLAYELLDPVLYSSDLEPRDMTRAAVARYVLRAAASIVVVPLPWKLASSSAVAYLAEHVVWFVLIVLAGVGSMAGIRRDPHLAPMLLGITLLSGAAIAYSSGNVGTLVRHRAMVFMPLAWFSSVGVCALVGQLGARGGAREYQPVHEPLGA